MGSTAGPEDPVYHYHSAYDSYHWMATFGDPGFVTHKSMAQVPPPFSRRDAGPFEPSWADTAGSISRCSPTSSPTAS